MNITCSRCHLPGGPLVARKDGRGYEHELGCAKVCVLVRDVICEDPKGDCEKCKTGKKILKREA